MKWPRLKAPRGSALAGLLLGLTAIFLLWQRAYITDSLVIWQHPPSAQVKSIASDSYLTDYARRVFYASRPQVDQASEFNEHCGNHERGSAILGCFVDYRVYLFNVDDEELDGIVEVTAAHELLHAAYQRLDESEKSKINTLLLEQAKVPETRKFIKERMSVYRNLDDESTLNEYHSIFGTELKSLVPELEQYYDNYFTDRVRLVGLYHQYSGIFKNLQTRADSIVAELNRKAKVINEESNQYRLDSANYSLLVKEFNRRAESGQVSQVDFEIRRGQLIQMRNNLNQTADRINQEIKAYNKKQLELKEVSKHLAKLNSSIDSSIEPLPRV